jgi:hypothetical protein
MINTLSNFDIDEILNKYNIKYNGIFSKDKLPSKLLNGFYVINLQHSKLGGGTHWTSLYKINDGYSLYYDSFGFPAAQDIVDKLHCYDYNNKDIQDINSSSCGYYCIGFIKFMNSHPNNPKKAFDTFIQLFSSDTKKNEYI